MQAPQSEPSLPKPGKEEDEYTYESCEEEDLEEDPTVDKAEDTPPERRKDPAEKPTEEKKRKASPRRGDRESTREDRIEKGTGLDPLPRVRRKVMRYARKKLKKKTSSSSSSGSSTSSKSDRTLEEEGCRTPIGSVASTGMGRGFLPLWECRR